MRLAHTSRPFVQSLGLCLCAQLLAQADPNPSAWLSLWLCNSQGKSMCKVQFEKRFWAGFGSLQVRLRSAVKFINTEGWKEILRGHKKENPTLEQHTGLVWKPWEFQVCPVKRAGVRAGEQLPFSSQKANWALFSCLPVLPGQPRTSVPLQLRVSTPRTPCLFNKTLLKNEKEPLVHFKKHLPGMGELPADGWRKRQK